MIEKQPLSEQHIINCLNTNYSINIINIINLPLGADIDARVYKAQAHDDSSYFIKLKRNHRTIAPIIQQHLHDAEIPEIIPPIKTNNGQLTCSLGEFTVTVYPFIEGKDGFSRNLTDEQWVTLGKALRNIHEFHIPPSIKNRIKQETYSPKWREAVRSIYKHIDTNPKITGEIALKILKIMKEQRKKIQHLVDRAEQLVKEIKKLSPELTLCHSDIHAGNVLITHDGALYIIDWDQPIMAPKERDLMFIGGGIGNVWNKSHEEELFYKGYGKTEINKKILAYYRYERIIEDIAVYNQELLFKHTQSNNKEKMYKEFLDLFAPNGVIDIAEKTDKNF